MFERLKQAFSSVTSAVKEKELTDKDLDDVAFNFQLSLIESDVAQSVAEALTNEVQKSITGTKVDRAAEPSEVVGERLATLLQDAFAKAGKVDLVANIKEKSKAGEPYVILFLGINGTGKTTTVAKMVRFMQKNGLSVVCAAGDTHRPGAIEQLTEHAERLSVKVISQRYGADPAAVGRDGVLYAKAHHVDCLLIDTAGRMQTNQNLMEEMAKIVRVVKPDFRIFVADALTGNDAVLAGRALQPARRLRRRHLDQGRRRRPWWCRTVDRLLHRQASLLPGGRAVLRGSNPLRHSKVPRLASRGLVQIQGIPRVGGLRLVSIRLLDIHSDERLRLRGQPHHVSIGPNHPPMPAECRFSPAPRPV